MKEREAAASIAAGLCVSIAALRMLAPELPFDWMTLVLILFAAVLVVLPVVIGKQKIQPPQDMVITERKWPGKKDSPATHPLAATMKALQGRMERAAWGAGEGGLFDALRQLHADKPFVALCAARGMLTVLSRQTGLGGEPMATISLLCSAMDAVMREGEEAADGKVVDQLFAYALCALGGLETIS